MNHSNHKSNTRHNPHAHRMLQRSAAYLLSNACQMGAQRANGAKMAPAQPHGAKNAPKASGTSHA